MFFYAGFKGCPLENLSFFLNLMTIGSADLWRKVRLTAQHFQLFYDNNDESIQDLSTNVKHGKDYQRERERRHDAKPRQTTSIPPLEATESHYWHSHYHCFCYYSWYTYISTFQSAISTKHKTHRARLLAH